MDTDETRMQRDASLFICEHPCSSVAKLLFGTRLGERAETPTARHPGRSLNPVDLGAPEYLVFARTHRQNESLFHGPGHGVAGIDLRRRFFTV